MNHPRSTADSAALSPAQGRTLVGSLLALAGLAVATGLVSGDHFLADPRRLIFAYLVAFIYVTTLSVGALAWLMLHHLTGAVWSVVVRRLMENLTRPIPWLAILFLPIALNLSRLYPWADASRLAADPAMARKAVWLNQNFFLARSAMYLAAWALLSRMFLRSSAREDRTALPVEGRAMRSSSSWGLVVLALTTGFASYDWLMSLDPDWSSTMFGVYFWAMSLVSSLAALILTVLGLRRLGRLQETITVEHLHDLGQLLFGFVIFWAYIAFCQYFLIWYSNFPEETRWYVVRRTGVWNTLSWSLFFGHFVAPFCLLLFRAPKRRPFWLGFAASWILVFHYIDINWLIMPALRPQGLALGWQDASATTALVCLIGAIVVRACQARPLVPMGDPRLVESAGRAP